MNRVLPNDVDLDPTLCRTRQKRLIQRMQEKHVDLAVILHPANIRWLTGAHFAWTFAPAAALGADGTMFLVGPENRMPAVVAADEVATYAARWHSTLRNDQRAASTAQLLRLVGYRAEAPRVGVEFSSVTLHWPVGERSTLIDLEPSLYELRRRKDPDELAVLRRAIDATAAMYQCAREIVQPGINELQVFSRLQEAAVAELGELLTATGNDYQSGSRGGAPRDREIQAGELYILDLGPAYRSYFADNARTLAVGPATDQQHAAREAVVQVLAMVEREVRPGVSAKAVFQHAQELLDQAAVGRFNHHLGHGIGLFPHEAPHLNPHWDDTFQEGEVFTAEPGLYDPSLRAGIRIENDYLVTADGVECLSPFPLDF